MHPTTSNVMHLTHVYKRTRTQRLWRFARSSSRILNILITASLFHFPSDYTNDISASHCSMHHFYVHAAGTRILFSGIPCFSRTRFRTLHTFAHKKVFGYVPVHSPVIRRVIIVRVNNGRSRERADSASTQAFIRFRNIYRKNRGNEIRGKTLFLHQILDTCLMYDV